MNWTNVDDDLPLPTQPRQELDYFADACQGANDLAEAMVKNGLELEDCASISDYFEERLQTYLQERDYGKIKTPARVDENEPLD